MGFGNLEIKACFFVKIMAQLLTNEKPGQGTHSNKMGAYKLST